MIKSQKKLIIFTIFFIITISLVVNKASYYRIKSIDSSKYCKELIKEEVFEKEVQKDIFLSKCFEKEKKAKELFKKVENKINKKTIYICNRTMQNFGYSYEIFMVCVGNIIKIKIEKG